MKVYDEYLKKEVIVQPKVTPEIGVEMKMDDPKEFKDIFDKGEDDEHCEM